MALAVMRQPAEWHRTTELAGRAETYADTTALFRELYDNASVNMDVNSIPPMVLILADYQYKAAFVADHELNIMAALTEIMAQCKFK